MEIHINWVYSGPTIGDLIKENRAKKKYDWTKLPQGTLVHFEDNQNHFDSDDNYYELFHSYNEFDDFAYSSGTFCPRGFKRTVGWNYCRLVEHKEFTYFDGNYDSTSPLPEGTMIEVVFCDYSKGRDAAQKYDWTRDGQEGEIIAYRIIGLDTENYEY